MEFTENSTWKEVTSEVTNKKQAIKEKTELVRTYFDENGQYIEVYDYPSIANGSRKRGRNEMQVNVIYKSPEQKEDISNVVTEKLTTLYMDWLYDLYIKEFGKYGRYETFVEEWFKFYEEQGKSKRDLILEWVR